MPIPENLRILLFPLLLAGATGMVFPQNLQEEITANRKRIEALQDEIRNYEKQLTEEKKKEQSEIQRLNETGRKIALLNRLMGTLEKNRELTELSSRTLQKQMEKTREEQKFYQDLLARRLVQIYKRREENPLAFILTAQSFTQAYARNKYLKMIADQDKKDIRALREKSLLLERQKREKEELLILQKETIRRKEEEARLIREEQKKREAALRKARKNRQTIASLIEERKEDLQTLKTLIAELERRRAETEKTVTGSAGKTKSTVIPKSNAGGLKDRLPYPVQGRIAISYGYQVHPTLGTKTFYPGVGIATSAAAPVYAVSSGVVSVVTYLRRFGNTVIIDHGNAFYTVYAHLGEIYVSAGDRVQTGERIARVDQADDGRPMLHFEIYKGQESVDPVLWLK